MDLEKNQREKGVLTVLFHPGAISRLRARDCLEIEEIAKIKKDGIKIKKGLDKADKIVYNK